VSDPAQTVVLVWRDGNGPHGAVHLPDSAWAMFGSWNPDAPDGGRNALLESLRDARAALTERGEDPDGLTLVGFGRGAVAAAGLTRYAKRLGIGLGPVVCVAATWDEPDPFSGDLIEEVPERIELVDRADEVPAVLAICWRPR
jgi:hypothetical protein